MESLLINERYRLDTKIGEGGMGVVYRALDTLLDETVAVKALKSDLQGSQLTHLERFLREGRALHKLNHPSIVRLLDMVEYRSHHYLIMDYIEGGNLRTLLSDNPLPAKRVLEIGLDLADALTRAHRLNIIHRDLKPANVLIAPDGTPRLTDFGVALIGSMERVTGEHILVGTIDYMSPETLQSASSDTKTDIWSFGILMYEMLTGERPFADSSPGIVVSNIIFGTVPDLEALCPHAPIALIDLIYRMLDKDPNTRISSMRLVGVELDALLNDTKTGETLSHTARGERSKSTFDTLTPSKPLLNNLPTRTTQFLGRETELLEINQLISQRKTREITFLAPGGMGKSRFALEIAYQQQSSFKDGVYFLELTSFDKDSNMITLIATALNFVLKVEGDEQKQQLLNYLSERELLIVFDNFDDLLNFAPLITEILEASPRTTVLVTSRRRLNLAIETVYNLGGMATPDWQNPTAAMQSGIVQLFLQGAKRAQARFELDETDLPHLARICEGVQGMPLGILLASSWVEMLSLSEIAVEVSKNLDFLETDISDIPERQRSIRVVFDYSWDLLTEEEQIVFLKLSVCRGGFTRMAAQSLTDAKLSVLMSLMSKSLIQRNADTGRYVIHELLRQYAAKKLRDSGGEVAALDAHSQYYANAIARRYPALCGKEQVTAIQDIDSDFENVYQAWLHALHHQHYDTAYQILFPLTRYCTLRNRYNEQSDLLQLAMDAIAHQPVRHVFQPILKALVGMNQSLRDMDYFKQCLQEVPTDDRAGLALVHQALGIVSKLNGFNQTAIEHHQQALDVYQSLNMIFEQANVLLYMSDCYLAMGDGAQAVALIENCLVLRNAIGDLRGQGAVMMQLGAVNLVRGNYDKVEEYWEQVLDIVEKVSGHRNAAPETATALALVYFLRGEVDRSLVLALEMVEVSKAYSLIDYEGFALAIVACCKVLQNDVASAVHYIQRMDALKSADFDYWIESDKHWARTLVAVASGDWEKAKRSCIEAMKAGLLSDGTLMIWSLPLSALILAQQDNREQATESIALSLTHPTAAQGWLQCWELFNTQVQMLKDNLGDRFDEAWTRGQAADLQTTVRQRISLLSE